MLSSDTTAILVGSLLAKAESRTRVGRYDDALDILAQAESGADGEHSEHWMGMVCAASARNKLHAQDDQGAMQFLGLIPEELRAANPKIDAECHVILGILLRREAYRCWKARQNSTALINTTQAIRSFESARKSAQMALEERLQHNAVLNRLYATGLQFAIQTQPQERYAALLVDAIMAEAGSRDSTPPNMRDDLTGLTIMADLACGGGIDLCAIPFLSNEPAFHGAMKKIIRYQSTSWPGLILDYVRDTSFCKNDVLVRALLLGCKMLQTNEFAADHGMQTEYAARLRICNLDIENTASNTELKRKIEEALSRFPQEIMRKVMSPRFLR